MQGRKFILLGLVLCFLSLTFKQVSGQSVTDRKELKPFTINHWMGDQSRIDLSFLLDTPAGRHGYITVQGDHFYTEDGSQIRFWGVNITDWSPGSVQIPSKENAAVWARALARHGVNMVRLTFLDFQAPRGLIDADRNDTRHFDPDLLDRFDYWVYQLKEHGIYVNFNLVVGRTYKEGDDVVDYENTGWAKYITYFSPRLIELQKELAQKWLTHKNPYTGTQYKNDPAIAIFELVNENTLFHAWNIGALHPPEEPQRDPNFKPITPYYSEMLTELFNEYLEQKYTPGELKQMRRLAGVAENEPIPRLKKSEVQSETDPGEWFHATMDFYMHVEQSYFEEMKGFLKNEVGMKSLLFGTSDFFHMDGPSYPMVQTNSTLDFLGGHMYWQHPSVEGDVNTPMVNDPGFSSVMRLSRTAVSGIPYMVPEVNNPSPNFYDSEGIPVISAYGGLQDWSGILLYTFELKRSNEYAPYIGDSFDISHHPVKMPQMAAGALMFLRGDVSVAEQTLERTYTMEQLRETMLGSEGERPLYTPEFEDMLVLKHGVRIGSMDGPPTQEQGLDEQNPIVSDTGELSWYLPQNEKGGMVMINAPRSQALVGFVRDYEASAENLSVDVNNEFCAVSLSSLDEDRTAIPSATRMLLVAGARAENTGTIWDEPQMRITDRGESPSRIEEVTGEVRLQGLEDAESIQVYPLDGSGQWIGDPVTAVSEGPDWVFPIGETTTTWYEIIVER